ncbi:hypothetical protein GQ42DRAFT_161858 [Ramicandelaber brevisporus]|nr:hypothetical protein GQ42DRAFT_161858 [Ramicandelaber brevisporus]
MTDVEQQSITTTVAAAAVDGASGAPQRGKSSLFIRNIPFDATNEELEQFASEVGPVRSCFVVSDQPNAKNNGKKPNKRRSTASGNNNGGGGDNDDEDDDADAIQRMKDEHSASKVADDSNDNNDGNDNDNGGDSKTVANSGPFRNKGFGFVQYVLPEDAERALKELTERKFRGERVLRVEFALRKNADDNERDQAVKGKDGKKNNNKNNNGISNKVDKDKPAPKPKTKAPKPSALPAQQLLRDVRIVDIPKNVNQKQLQNYIRKQNGFKSLELTENKDEIDTKTMTIHFTTPKDAQSAVASINSNKFNGITLAAELYGDLKAAAVEAAKIAVSTNPSFVDKRARLIVRNWPFKALNEKAIRDAFNMAVADNKDRKAVMSIDIPRKGGAGGTLMGFAFVQMRCVPEADEAIEKLNGSKQLGRTVAVDYALSKKDYEAVEEEEEEDDDAAAVTDSDDDDDDDDDDDGESGSELEVDGDEDEDEDGMDVDDDDEEKDEGDSTSENKSSQEFLPSTTLFIRNMAYETDEDTLYERFSTFGRLRYCRITRDRSTGASKGTGFACFWEPSDAKSCLVAAERVAKLDSSELLNLNSQASKGGAAASSTGVHVKSVLVPERPKSLPDELERFIIDGRVLMVTMAVDRSTAEKLTKDGIAARSAKQDKRNVSLLTEGAITSAAAKDAEHLTRTLSAVDVERRIASFQERKTLLNKNPNLFISRTRLSVRGLPLRVTEADLRKAAAQSIDKFKAEVKAGKRAHLTKDEQQSGGWDKKAHVKQAKIVRAKDRVDGKSGLLRSKGYGFLEFEQHAHALACLRYLNGRTDVFAKQADAELEEEQQQQQQQQQQQSKKNAGGNSRKSLVIEFSIENSLVLRNRDQRRQSTLKRARDVKDSIAAAAADDAESGKQVKRARTTPAPNKKIAPAVGRKTAAKLKTPKSKPKKQ